MSSSTRTPKPAESPLWELIDELRQHDDGIEEGIIMGGRSALVSGQFLGIVDCRASAWS